MIGNLNKSDTEFLIWLVNRVETGEVSEQFRVAWTDGGGLILGANLKSGDEPVTVQKQQMAVLSENQYLSTNDMKSFSITARAYREVENYLRKVVLEYAYNSEKTKPVSTIPTANDIVKLHKIDLPIIEGTVENLVAQDYLKPEAHFVGNASAFSITPTGQNELSRLQSTNFSPTQVNQTFNSPVGAVQTGQGNVANVTQHIGASLTEVTSILSQLRASLSELPPEKQEEAADVLEMLQEEVEADKLDQKKVNRAMKFLQRLSRGIGNSTKWAGSLVTLIAKLKEMGVPIDQIPNLFS